MTGREFFKKYRLLLPILQESHNLSPVFLKKTIYLLSGGKIQILLRYLQLKESGKKIGENVYLADKVVIKNAQNLNIGDNCSIHEFSYLDAAGDIIIGDNVSIAHNCSLISFEHTWSDKDTPIKYNKTRNMKITIGNDVWIGCGVRILAGSVIEDRVIVAAGAVVRGELESGYIYGGVPARKIKKI